MCCVYPCVCACPADSSTSGGVGRDPGPTLSGLTLPGSPLPAARFGLELKELANPKVFNAGTRVAFEFLSDTLAGRPWPLNLLFERTWFGISSGSTLPRGNPPRASVHEESFHFLTDIDDSHERSLSNSDVSLSVSY